ncbi:hypothetical protein A2331_06070 [Candidatus Falkowbacteria bacterium RIFOXYB2_FULL_34_18]|uniref:Methyltransferase type 11 domain-containing protein n=1 Tax=Candidatus Falkowbacteria bacterium RIFOXYD2_FULL_34_120 TaxID=1798007 RepID=A0A1F5TP32_9BACT|nr:MAG: hypothetical protein A2331_06070 [Candidatus Falkowbacteria bacterium RIFOXYB2_FULL_34_18]OGF28992.1 MAG: hypothetical protein A2500_01855 [Candidatus Falkowbacteria bacterium RIFOXYC12_FULL_34_55]OGF35888.1 MAG: hypothetical protein A2466_02285 [Candidatus Falkowbacteria bacterium RIFOXYC2_FULL_34_220]OGF38485.1 MAG: hypothetical protein A2515_03070 [Candidatus Falkowbacteria bacterium RIFOXYD12_FULL_34_57]OGF40564.1 MAG: hypothetical protein A2531_03475 [Candidatus Falkowbacteria bact
MKGFFLFVVRGVLSCLRISKLRKKLIFKLRVFESYLKQGECKKYQDCLELQKIYNIIPRVSDRDFEYPWVIKNVDIKEGRLLDVGSAYSDLLFDLLPQKIEISAIDLNNFSKNKNIQFVIGDIRKTDFRDNYFDCITCVSTLEHIGVIGRYGSDEDPRGDIRAVKEMHRILKRGGALLVTVPYGIRDVLPINKLYNKERIEILLKDFDILEQKYLKYDKKWDFWFEVNEQEASTTDMIKDGWYSLAFIKALKK